jgi:hypothetical protein
LKESWRINAMGNSVSISKGGILDEVQATLEAKLFCSEAETLNYSEERISQVASLTFLELRVLLASGQESLAEVVKILHRKKQLLRNSNCALTDVFYAEAIRRAENLDQELTEDPSAVLARYPLLGCVLSLKDSVIYRGSSSTHGFWKGYNKPFAESA